MFCSTPTMSENEENLTFGSIFWLCMLFVARVETFEDSGR